MRKERLARCPKGMRQAHRYIMEIDERAIERGWEEVVTVERNYSERAAKLLADHYLFGMCWQDAATESKLAIDKAKKEAYAALIWLDTHDRSNQTK
ncbi:hypothetical protein K6V98_08250 [Collinsella sp. AGMB00827]|uniref:DUF3310 domain-containing protein n=1 Tax=Collinsella ureilytica TaxID=2869515 RepID=A0ABS7MPN7_9ACTN|nr:hypothetical protein [Collinsella urealyticum]MBY4798335.1 hypothetical protein [Collinsella urealyticum]